MIENNDIIYDFAIIGLGTAGSTIARLLDSRFSVIAIDKKSSDENSFKKPCGGLLAEDAQKALSKFNLVLPKDVLVDPQIFHVKTIDTKQNLTRNYQKFYINVDRHKFDAWITSLIPKNVTIKHRAVCTSLEKELNSYILHYSSNGVEHSVKARFVIGADGSNSIVRKVAAPNKHIKQYLSIVQTFAEQHQVPFYSCIFDSDITDSYCWSASKDGIFHLGGAFPIKSAKSAYELLKVRLVEYGFLLGSPIETKACLVSMPRKISDFCCGKDGLFLIGESAGFISPSSLEGISYALNSAFVLAKLLNTGGTRPLLKYNIKTIPLKLKLVLKMIKFPFMYLPFLRKLVMKSGLDTIDVI